MTCRDPDPPLLVGRIPNLADLPLPDVIGKSALDLALARLRDVDDEPVSAFNNYLGER